jgi:hypothetical protein
MARLIKSGKNAGVIVLSKKDLADGSVEALMPLIQQQQAEKREQEQAYNELLEDLGSPQAVAAFLKG